MVKVYGAIGESLWGFVEPHICSPMAPYIFTYSPISFHPHPISFHLQREFRFPFIYLQARKRIVCLLFKDKQTNQRRLARRLSAAGASSCGQPLRGPRGSADGQPDGQATSLPTGCPRAAPHLTTAAIGMHAKTPSKREGERASSNGAHARPTHRHRTPQASYARD